jgi:transcriptional regulator with XRE-family HTH domain
MDRHLGVGSAVRLARNRAQLTAAQLAELCGVSEQTILRIERGDNDPSLSTLRAIATGLRVDVATLLGPDDQE